MRIPPPLVPRLIEGLFLFGAVGGLVLAVASVAVAIFGAPESRALYFGLAVGAAGTGACNLLMWWALRRWRAE